MSENPYQAPVPNPRVATASYPANKAPTGLKVICILCIILGAWGLFGSVIGIGSLLYQEEISELQIQIAPPEQQEMQIKMAEAQASFFIPNMIFAICNLVIGPLLLLGGIGVLIKKIWGAKILSRALIAAAIFILIRTVAYSFFQVKIFGIMKEMIMDQIQSAPGQGGAGAGTMETVMMTSMYFGVALGVVWTLALTVFYFWGWRYLKKDACQGYLTTFSQ